MARVKRGTTAHKRRKKVLAQAKGFRWGRKSKYRLAKDALRHAWEYAYRDRRTKKRVFRQGWNRNIGAAARQEGMNYSKLIAGLKKQNVQLDRKILAELAKSREDLFKQIIEKAK